MPCWLITGGRTVAGTFRSDPGLWHRPVQDPAAWVQHHPRALLFPGNAPRLQLLFCHFAAWPPHFLSTRNCMFVTIVNFLQSDLILQLADIGTEKLYTQHAMFRVCRCAMSAHDA